MSQRDGAVSALLERRPELDITGGQLDAALALLERAFDGGGRVYVGGNGGSAADSEHIVGELMKSMGRPRPLPASELHAVRGSAPEALAHEAEYLAQHLEGALPTVCLTSQSGLISAVANDTAGDMAMAQQVYGYGRPGDLFWGISTSGSSRNVVLAALAARARGMAVLAMTASHGEPLAGLADVAVRVPATGVGAAQELHLSIYHALCDALETRYFGAS